jgi:hypothetical protein
MMDNYKDKQKSFKALNRNLAKPHELSKGKRLEPENPRVNPKGFRHNYQAKQEHKKQAYASRQYAIDNRYQQLRIPQKKD